MKIKSRSLLRDHLTDIRRIRKIATSKHQYAKAVIAKRYAETLTDILRRSKSCETLPPS